MSSHESQPEPGGLITAVVVCTAIGVVAIAATLSLRDGRTTEASSGPFAPIDDYYKALKKAK